MTESGVANVKAGFITATLQLLTICKRSLKVREAKLKKTQYNVMYTMYQSHKKIIRSAKTQLHEDRQHHYLESGLDVFSESLLFHRHVVL